jgi:hypothetical protein
LENFRGGYIHYDGSENELYLGVHGDDDTLTTSDRNIVTIERASGDVGIKNENPGYSLEVGTDGTNGNGAHVTDGGIWTSGSSRTFKTNFENVDPIAILERLSELPVQRWEYKLSDEGVHLGPVAEDFYQAFGLGNDERYIGTVDSDGVSMAAIQGLYALVRELQTENERMRAALKRAGIE